LTSRFHKWRKIDYTWITTVSLGGVINLTENNEAPKKKISLQEAMKQQLANKKNQAAANKGTANGDMSTKKMKSQLTKKPSNTRRKMGT
jgi:hypothetical protein